MEHCTENTGTRFNLPTFFIKIKAHKRKLYKALTNHPFTIHYG